MMLFRTRPNRPELEATKIPTAIDIAWSAGIYEGEGCCRLCGRGKRSFMVAVVQKDPELLYRLREWFGGSIQDQGPKHDVRVWNLCGDRARIFIGLIYSFMTARRKEQIDSTGTLDFLNGASTVGMSMQDLKDKLFQMYQQHRETTWRGNVQLSRENSRRHYAINRLNPEWVEKDRERKRKKKQEKQINVVEIKKTA